MELFLQQKEANTADHVTNRTRGSWTPSMFRVCRHLLNFKEQLKRMPVIIRPASGDGNDKTMTMCLYTSFNAEHLKASIVAGQRTH